MRISYYCQHVLGVGHLRRSLEICKSLAKDHETTLILGGPPTSIDTTGMNVLQLPGLQMDTEFNNLAPCDTTTSLEATKEMRQNVLYNHFVSSSPECFITELYPFGRKAFRFEIDPVLKDIKNKTLPDCKCIVSVRDILVEKQQGKEKFEHRVVETLNNYYSAVLIHADPQLITLDETFTPFNKINIPIHYTGFVSERPSSTGNRKIRERLNLSREHKLIVTSIGGGSVGEELLYAVLEAFKKLVTSEPLAHLQIFTGPYCASKDYKNICSHKQHNITVDRFTDSFPDWLTVADLSISMAGYNTCMNILQTGVPALVLPFMQNREQTLRAKKLGEKVPMSLLTQEDLTVNKLSAKMAEQLKRRFQTTTIALNGANKSSIITNSILTAEKK
ncbi:MAG: putative glycosyltransferase [Desulforhopalus sp.]|jgi:predicted glycosyltransferase